MTGGRTHTNQQYLLDKSRKKCLYESKGTYYSIKLASTTKWGNVECESFENVFILIVSNQFHQPGKVHRFNHALEVLKTIFMRAVWYEKGLSQQPLMMFTSMPADDLCRVTARPRPHADGKPENDLSQTIFGEWRSHKRAWDRLMTASIWFVDDLWRQRHVRPSWTRHHCQLSFQQSAVTLSLQRRRSAMQAKNKHLRKPHLT